MGRTIDTALKCLAALAVVGNLGALGYYVHREAVQARKEEAAQALPPPWVANRTVKVTARQAAAFGLETERAQPAGWRERVVALGRVVADPAATHEVRAPFAG